MRRQSPMVPRVAILVVCLLLSACWKRETPADPAVADHETVKTPTNERPKHGEWQISSLTESEGQLLVELLIGSRQGVDTNTFFRVYDPERPGVIKCMLKTREVLGPEQSLAIMIGGLFDLNNPLSVGDPVRSVDDLGLYGSGQQVERTVTREIERIQTEAQAEQEQFDSLREQFQRRLRELMAEHDRDVVARQTKHEQAMQEMKSRHQRALEAKDLERRSDLAALRTTLMQDARSQVEQKGLNMQKRIRELSEERDTLQGQVDKLLREQQRLRDHITTLIQEQADKRQEFEDKLRAEIETRSILQARLAQIEKSLEPGDARPETILSASPDRNETILERLERITEERDQARAKVKLLSGRLDVLQTETNQLRKRLDIANTRLAVLESQDSDENSLRRQLAKSQVDLNQTKEFLDAANLTRLEAERQLYELVIRILRMSSSQPQQLDYLKASLRDLVASDERVEVEP